MAKRRSNGEGSFWQLPDRTWVHQITIGRKEDGSLQRKSFKGATKKICKQRKEEWLAEQERLKTELEQQNLEKDRVEEYHSRLGHYVEAETLFEPAFMDWLKLYKSPPTRKPSTYASYMETYNAHFADFFGQMPLYQITQDVLQEYYQQKQLSGARKDGKEGGLSPKTIRNHHMILKDFFAYAAGRYKLDNNPALCTARPTVVQKEMRVLSPYEMKLFMEEVMKETQRIAILTDLFTGMRIGELLALKISDLDLERQTLSINKNLLRVNTTALSLDNPGIQILNYDPEKKTHLIVQDTPKTKSSNREIAISDGLCELLIRHLFTLANSSWPNPENLLFPSKTGTYIDPKSFDIRLSAISKRCAIKRVNPHALRHTLATRLVEERIPLNIVQEILGHASIVTTRKYLHKNVDIERNALSMMTDQLDMDQFGEPLQLNGAKKRARFADIKLPDFSSRPAKKGPRGKQPE